MLAFNRSHFLAQVRIITHIALICAELGCAHASHLPSWLSLLPTKCVFEDRAPWPPQCMRGLYLPWHAEVLCNGPIPVSRINFPCASFTQNIKTYNCNWLILMPFLFINHSAEQARNQAWLNSSNQIPSDQFGKNSTVNLLRMDKQLSCFSLGIQGTYVKK